MRRILFAWDAELRRRIIILLWATSIAASGAFLATSIAAHEAEASLILDNGAEEYAIRPPAEDADALMDLFAMSESADYMILEADDILGVVEE